MVRRSICVYCGSSTKVSAEYLSVARDLGQAIGRGGHTLIWGGGSVGLMGELALGAQQVGGRVVGVIPQFLVDGEVAYRQADELIVTADMRQRKAAMEERADAFIVLPGGLGTLEEMFEILTLRLLGQHDKPLVILNHRGFYDSLFRFLDQLYDQRFAREVSRSHYRLAGTPGEALAALDGQSAFETKAPSA